VPFDFERRRVSVLIDDGQVRLLVVKGAPEEMIQLSVEQETANGEVHALDEAARHRLLQQFERLGEAGYRVLSVACRRISRTQDSAARSDENQRTFVGFATFVDPPKVDAAAAIQALAAVGVEVKILTGDNERITRHICSEIGVPVRGVVTGPELLHMSEAGLRARLASVNLFCRVTPQQKERILLALKRMGRVAGYLAMASTMPPRCMRRMWASRSTAPPTLPKRPPISCCSSTISASCMTA
jgi:P-type Mg2+ transporter